MRFAPNSLRVFVCEVSKLTGLELDYYPNSALFDLVKCFGSSWVIRGVSAPRSQLLQLPGDLQQSLPLFAWGTGNLFKLLIPQIIYTSADRPARQPARGPSQSAAA